MVGLLCGKLFSSEPDLRDSERRFLSLELEEVGNPWSFFPKDGIGIAIPPYVTEIRRVSQTVASSRD